MAPSFFMRALELDDSFVRLRVYQLNLTRFG